MHQLCALYPQRASFSLDLMEIHFKTSLAHLDLRKSRSLGAIQLLGRKVYNRY